MAPLTAIHSAVRAAVRILPVRHFAVRRLPTTTSVCSFFNITYSNQQLSLFTVFLSIPQTTENLTFPSILSSLDYLLSRLTLWNSNRTDLHVIHTPFHFSFISTSSRSYFFFIHDVLSVPEKADRNPFLSALWCTLYLPHSLTLLISPHSITCLLITHQPLFLIEDYIKYLNIKLFPSVSVDAFSENMKI